MAPATRWAWAACMTVDPLPRAILPRMGITSGSITAMLDRVECAGRLVRSVNPEDRRRALVSIPPAGTPSSGLHEESDAPNAGPDRHSAGGQAVHRLCDLISIVLVLLG